MGRAQVMFLLGPSGVGKSTVAEALCSSPELFHLDADGGKGFKAYGLKGAWVQLWAKGNAEPLAAALDTLASENGRRGVIVSLPSRKKHLLDPNHVEIARRAGFEIVLLWGTEELCKRARFLRDAERGLPWREAKYDEGNRRTFELYRRPEYADIRIDVFRPDGSRRPTEEIVAAIRQRSAGPRKSKGPFRGP